VLGNHNVNAVATAIELVCQHVAMQETLAAVNQGWNLASTFGRYTCGDFDGAASARVDHTPSDFNRRSGAANRCWLTYGGWLAANRCWFAYWRWLAAHGRWLAADRGWFAYRGTNRRCFAAIVLVLATEKASLCDAWNKHARYGNSTNSNQNSLHQILS
tara:strand:+ start:1330 stop:1806 length:477 start_codon:yes stop_codon:yes gene_type:complete